MAVESDKNYTSIIRPFAMDGFEGYGELFRDMVKTGNALSIVSKKCTYYMYIDMKE